MRDSLLCFALFGALALGSPDAHSQAKKSKSPVVKKSAPTKSLSIRQGPSKWFLSHTEFTRLTPSEQKQYLRQLRKVLGGLTTQSRFFAEVAPASSGKSSRSIASNSYSLTSTGVGLFMDQAENWRGEPPMVIEYTNASRHPEFLERWQRSMWWLITARVSLAQIPDSDPGKAALKKRIEELERFYVSARRVAQTSFAKNNELSREYESLQKARNGDVDFNTPNLIPPGALMDVADRQQINWQPLQTTVAAETPTPATTPQPVEEIRVIPLDNASAETAPAETPVTDISGTLPVPEESTLLDPIEVRAPAEELPSLRGYRCMYSGFVIKNDPCRGPQELPEDLSFEGISSDGLSCGENQVLCNPLLFGLRLECALGENLGSSQARSCLQSGRPVCVARGKFATRDCGTQSESEGHLASAAALIQANPSVWREYLISFYELCDDKMIVLNEFAYVRNGQVRDVPESTLTDIAQTCDNAKRQLSKLTEQYRVDGSRPAGGAGANGEATTGQQ